MFRPVAVGARIAACALLAAVLAGCATTPGREQAWGYVVSTAFSPDGATLAAVTNENEVALFDAAPLKFRQPLTGPSDRIDMPRGYAESIATVYRTLPVRFSPDGGLLASSGSTGLVTVWVTATGEARSRLAIGGTVTDLAWAPNSQTLVTTGPSAVLWSMADGTRTAELPLPPGAQPTAASMSPDGRRVAIGLSTGEIALFDTATRAPLQTLKAHAAPVSGLSFQPDGAALASTAGGYDLRLWKNNPDNTFEETQATTTAAAAGAQAEIDRAQGFGGLLWLLGTLRGFQIAGAPTLGAPPLAASAQSSLARAARATPFHCGSRVVFSADGRYLASSANLMACADCIGTLAPAFLTFVTELGSGKTTTVRDLGCDIALSPDGQTLSTAGPGAPQLRSSVSGRPLPVAP